jgi:hypothetical protein
VIVCGLAVPLSVIDTLAPLGPPAVGVNVTLIVHVPFTASVAGLIGQVVVSEKSPGFVPVIEMLLIVNVPGPLFVTVTICGELDVFTV